jgi:hypothetical protein
MATPTMVTITGNVQTPPGTPDGTFAITLEMLGWLSHSDGTLIEPTKYTETVDGAGNVSFSVPDSTDPNWLYTDFPRGVSGTEWAYRVTFDPIDNLPQRAPFYAVVSGPGPLTLNDLVPPGSPLSVALYAPLNHHHTPDQVGFLILGPVETVPPSTPANTVIIRKAA